MKTSLFTSLALSLVFSVSACSFSSSVSVDVRHSNAPVSPQAASAPSVDYEAICNVLAGKGCGHRHFDDDDIRNCAKDLEKDYLSHLQCENSMNAFFQCLLSFQPTPCADPYAADCQCVSSIDAACEAQRLAGIACLSGNYPDYEPEEDISNVNNADYEAFCNIISGRACGVDVVTDADIQMCIQGYKIQSVQYSKCANAGNDYLQCVNAVHPNQCEDPTDIGKCVDSCVHSLDDACASKEDIFKACLAENYPDAIDDDDADNRSDDVKNGSDTIDFVAFCNVITGKASGYPISDENINMCVDVYKAEAAKYKKKCGNKGEKYYNCVIHAEVIDCRGKENCSFIKGNDACQNAGDDYGNCMRN